MHVQLRRMGLTVAIVCISCGGKKEPEDARAVAVLDACGRGAYYPGVTDSAAPKAHVVVHLVNGLPEGVVPTKVGSQPGVCLLLDGKVLLSPKDQVLIEARADKKETITWDGTVSPGDHTMGMALSLRDGQSVSGRAMNVTTGGTVTIGVSGQHGDVAWAADGDVALRRMR